ncbi:4Fe-4S ferredoxin, iron-sulfur binding [Ruegeria lacuscaerulensis ITI-1157]|nr:4Fe-4S ferredoxin, iron-sulfur binding [Ruegeria lacuscaerulensis ITI-1157]SHJ36946.1 citrate/tricarballylate utilization protein [Ruegeria lacuscaerulensis ITI-1157]
MPHDVFAEARRQAEICNACRYCEGFCSVFPALQADRAFSDGDLTQLANLCHNCRGCYYACQYTAPHEFDVNLPRALAELRTESWERFAWPGGLARMFQRHAGAVTIAVAAGFALLLALVHLLGSTGAGDGFYAAMSHGLMVSIFLPAFFFPLTSLAISLRRYWRAVGGGRVRGRDIAAALGKVARMKDLAAGHGEGCNFEDEDRFSQARRLAHQAIMYGFLLCFAATGVATLMHYLWAMPAPYPFLSAPKLLGVSGGVLLGGGALWIAALKTRAERSLSDPRAWAAEMGFVLLLAFIAASGLALYGLGSTAAMPLLLALHLGAVLAFFVLAPFTKMAHGAYRFAALLRDATRTKA